MLGRLSTVFCLFLTACHAQLPEGCNSTTFTFAAFSDPPWTGGGTCDQFAPPDGVFSFLLGVVCNSDSFVDPVNYPDVPFFKACCLCTPSETPSASLSVSASTSSSLSTSSSSSLSSSASKSESHSGIVSLTTSASKSPAPTASPESQFVLLKPEFLGEIRGDGSNWNFGSVQGLTGMFGSAIGTSQRLTNQFNQALGVAGSTLTSLLIGSMLRGVNITAGQDLLLVGDALLAEVDENGVLTDGTQVSSFFTTAFSTVEFGAGDQFGSAIRVIPDLDGNGVDDILIGSQLSASPVQGSGTFFLLFMDIDVPNGKFIVLDTFEFGFPQPALQSHAKYVAVSDSELPGSARFWFMLSSDIQCVDLNGDGELEILIGSPGCKTCFDADPSVPSQVLWNFPGTIVVVNLKVSPSRVGTDASNILDFSTALRISSIEAALGIPLDLNAQFGYSFGIFQDITGDGISELIVGAPGLHSGRGAIFLVSVVLTQTNTLRIQFIQEIVLPATNAGARCGSSITVIPDANGDGRQEIVVGCSFKEQVTDVTTETGEVIVLSLNVSNPEICNFYSARGVDVSTFSCGVTGAPIPFLTILPAIHFGIKFSVVVDRSTIPVAASGWQTGLRAGDGFGESVEFIGDINGDGLSEIAIGAPYHTGTNIANEGAVYLLTLVTPSPSFSPTPTQSFTSESSTRSTSTSLTVSSSQTRSKSSSSTHSNSGSLSSTSTKSPSASTTLSPSQTVSKSSSTSRSPSSSLSSSQTQSKTSSTTRSQSSSVSSSQTQSKTSSTTRSRTSSLSSSQTQSKTSSTSRSRSSTSSASQTTSKTSTTSHSASQSRSGSSTNSRAPSQSASASQTRSRTASSSQTQTASSSPTQTRSKTSSATQSPSSSQTSSRSPTSTVSGSQTPSPSETQSVTPTFSPSQILSPSPHGTPGCRAIAPATDDWCVLMCLTASPSFCPDSLCVCGFPDVPPENPIPCVAINSPATNAWCTENCNREYCPPDFCECPIVDDGGGNNHVSQCANFTDALCTALCRRGITECPVNCCVPTLDPLVVSPRNDTACCSGVTKLLVSSGPQIFRLGLDNTGSIVQPMSLCAEFEDVVDIKVDNLGGAFVADAKGKILYVSPDCSKVITISRWPDHPIGLPSSVAIVDGGLYVADSTAFAIWFVSLNSDYSIRQLTKTSITFSNIVFMSAQANGLLYFVERGQFVFRYDPQTNVPVPYLDALNVGIVDIKGITVVDSCGVYLTARGNNQVWRCPDLLQGSSCAPLCRNVGDASSCLGMQSPFGVTVDCQCNVHVSNTGNGNIVRFPSGQQESVLFHAAGLLQAMALAC